MCLVVGFMLHEGASHSASEISEFSAQEKSQTPAVRLAGAGAAALSVTAAAALVLTAIHRAARTPAPELEWRVVHKVPDELADWAVLALIDLGGLDDLLLQGGWDPPVHHVARALVLVGCHDEARIMRSQARREHASTPWPPGVLEPTHSLSPAAYHISACTMDRAIQDLDVHARVESLLLTRVRDLWNHRKDPLLWRADAAEIAIADSEDVALAPGFAFLRWISWLLGYLQLHVEVDPATAAWSLLAQRLCRHEVIRGLHTDADVLLRWLVWHLDVIPELLVAGIVLLVVELFDIRCVHVLLAVLSCSLWQRTQRQWQEVNNCDLQVWEEVLKLRGPFNTDEARTDHENL